MEGVEEKRVDNLHSEGGHPASRSDHRRLELQRSRIGRIIPLRSFFPLTIDPALPFLVKRIQYSLRSNTRGVSPSYELPSSPR
jgi:hypothetical protein